MNSAVVSEARAPYGMPPRMTEDEFVDWYRKQDDTVHAEWVDGEVILIMPDNLEHNEIVGFLGDMFRAFVRKRKCGKIFTESVQIRLPWPSRREPDLIFVSGERRNILQKTFVEGPPDLALEIVSPDSIDRDYVKKYKEYEAGGIRELWLVDPLEKKVAAYCLNEKGKYKRISIKHGKIESHVLPGFYLRPEWLWKADDLDPIDLLKEMGAI